VLLLVFIAILGFIFWNKNIQKVAPDTPVAKVGDAVLPRAYVDLELSFFPGKPTPEIEKTILEKIVNDQITLEAGKKEGLIADYPQSANLSSQEYLQRTNLVKEIKKAVNDKGSVIKGKMVEEGKYCPNILTQSLAVENSLESFNAHLLENHLTEHVSHQFMHGQSKKAVEELVKIYKLANK
jgi:DNA-binding FrmR family transcriptional regulator